MSIRRLLGFVLALGLVAAPACGPAAVGPEDEQQDPEQEPPLRLPGSDFDCGDIPEQGICSGESAIYCDARSARVVEKRCGARGLTCDDSGSQVACVNDDGEEEAVEPEPSADPEEEAPGESTSESGGACGSVTYAGECDDATNTLRYCDNDELTVVDCGSFESNGYEPRTCSWSEDASYFACLPTNVEDHACGDLALVDQCDTDTNTLLWCGTDQDTKVSSVISDPCGDDALCTIDNEGGGSCEPLGCADLGYEGKCTAQGTSFRYCSSSTDTEVITVACSGDETCVYDAGTGYADCQ